MTVFSERVLVLVHGTIPRTGPFRLGGKPKWTEASSSLCSGLISRLESQPDPQRFLWSGRNSHTARLDASVDLASFLRRIVEDRPAARIFIIAHSHGGNVAMYALRSLDQHVIASIGGLVCLGTPFVHALERDVDEVARLFQRSILPGLVALLLIPLGIAVSTSVLAAGAVLLWSFVGLLGCLILFFGWYLPGPIRTQWLTKAKEVASVLRADGQSGTPVLCARSQRDEAKFLLSRIQAISDFIVNLWNLPLVDILGEILSPVTAISSHTAIGGRLLASAMMLPYLGVAVLCNLFTRAAPWGFGERLLLNWFVAIEVRNAPPDRNNTIVLDYPRSRIWALNHCLLPDNKKLIDDIVLWIKGELDETKAADVFSLFHSLRTS